MRLKYYIQAHHIFFSQVIQEYSFLTPFQYIFFYFLFILADY